MRSGYQAVVLAGGMGTRLRPLTNTRPKPLLPVLGRPCVEYVLRSLASAGVGQVFLTCGYRAHDMIDVLGNGKQFGIDMEYNIEETPAGTAGAVKLLEHKLHGTFVVASGDVLADVDVQSLVEQHKERKAVATMALTRVDRPEEFGIVGLDDNGRIVRFKEKPKTEEAFSNLINAGIYVLEPEVLPLIPSGQMFDFSKNLFPKMMEGGMAIYGSELSGLWKDIGRPSDLLEANIRMADRKGKKISHPGAEIEGKIVASHFNANGAMIRGPVFIGENASLGKGSSLIECAVYSGSEVKEGAIIERSLVLDSSIISKNSVVRGSIIGERCFIGPGVEIANSTLGDGVRLEGPSSIENELME